MNSLLRISILTLTGSLGAAAFLLSASGEEKKEDRMETKQKLEILRYFSAPPGQAPVPTSVESVRFFNEAVAHYLKREYTLAAQALQESLKMDPTNAHAYELLGDIAYQGQNLKEAKANYQIAYSFNSSPELREKIEKLVTEERVESTFASYDEEHFVIKYEDSDRTVEGYEFRELLREAYRVISSDFAYYFQNKITVLLYEEKQFRTLQGIPHWSMGLYDGKVRMPLSRGKLVDQDLAAVARHEVTHAFVAAMSRGKAPSWINEGLAEYEENKVRPVDLQHLKDAMRNQRLIPWDSLFNRKRIDQIQDASQVALFYQQSYSIVDYLVERYRMFHVKKMLEAFGNNKTPDEVIREVLMTAPQTLEAEWKVSLQKKLASGR